MKQHEKNNKFYINELLKFNFKDILKQNENFLKHF